MPLPTFNLDDVSPLDTDTRPQEPTKRDDEPIADSGEDLPTFNLDDISPPEKDTKFFPDLPDIETSTNRGVPHAIAPRDMDVETARLLSKDIDPVQAQLESDTSVRYNIDRQQAKFLLSKAKPQDLALINDQEALKRRYPGISTAMSPEFYQVMKESPEWAKQTELAIRGFGEYSSDIAGEVGKGGDDFKIMAIASNLIFNGVTDRKKAIEDIKRIRRERDSNPLAKKYNKGLKEFGQAGEGLGNVFGNAMDVILNAGKLFVNGDDDTHAQFVKSVIDLKLKGFDQEEAIDALVNYGRAIKRNPKELGLLFARNTPQMALPALLSAIGGLSGGPAGFTAAGAVGTGVMAFGQYILQELESFSDSQGNIDYIDFFSPEHSAQMRKEAAAYGLGHAAIQAVFNSFAGINTAKAIKGGGSGLKKTIGVAAGAVKDVAKQLPEEGLGEIAGLASASILGGSDVEGKDIIKQAAEEVAVGFGGAVITTALGTMSRIAGESNDKFKKKKIKQKLKEIHTELESSKEADHNHTVIKKIREIFKKTDIVKKYPAQAKRLIEAALDKNIPVAEIFNDSPEPNVKEGADPQTTEESDIEAGAKETIRKNNAEASNGKTVEFLAHQWEIILLDQGLDPLTEISIFGDDAVADYQKALESGGSIFIGTAEFMIASNENPEIFDELGRFNGASKSKLESEDTKKHVFENLEDFFSEDIETPLGEITPEIEPLGPDDLQQGEPLKGDPVLRPIILTEPSRGLKEKLVFRRLGDKFRRSLSKAPVTPEMLSQITEVTFRQVRKRAEVLGIPIEDLEALIEQRENTARFRKEAKGGSITTGAFSNIVGNSFHKVLMFGENSNIRTVMHELGHMWFHDMGIDWDILHKIKDTDLTDDQREYKNSMEIVRSLMEKRGQELDQAFTLQTLEDISERRMSHEMLTHLHETFSQSSENYFMHTEDKENSQLKPVMNMFRQWMADAWADRPYWTYQDHPPFGLSEVANVFDNIIAATETENERKPMFEPPMFDPEMLGAKFPEYQIRLDDAHVNSLSDIYHKLFVKKQKLFEKEDQKIIDQAVDQAVDEIEDLPEMIKTRVIQEAPSESKLNSESLFKLARRVLISQMVEGEILSDDAIKKRLKQEMPKDISRAKSKVTVEEMMQFLGVQSHAEFFRILTVAGKENQLINERINELVELAEPTLKSDDEIHNAVIAEMHGLGREKLLKFELDFLAQNDFTTLKKFIGVAISSPDAQIRKTQSVLKEEARALVWADSWKRPPRHFMKSATEMNREAKRLLLAGDINGAMLAKQKEAVQFFAAKEATRLQKKAARINQQMKRMMKIRDSKIKNYYAIGMWNFGRAVIESAVGKPILVEGKLVQRPIPPLDMTHDRLKLLTIDSDQLLEINMLIDFYNRVNKGKSVDNITMESWLALGEITARIRVEARKAKSVIIDGKVFQTQVAVDTATAEFSNIEVGEDTGKKTFIPKKGDKTFTYQKRNGNSNWKADVTTMRTLLVGLFKNEEEFAKSEIGRQFNTILSKEADFSLHKDEGISALYSTLRELSKKDSVIATIVDPITGKFFGHISDPIVVELSAEQSITFNSVSQLLMAVAHGGSESGLSKLLGGGVNDSGPLAILPEQWDAAIAKLIEDGVLEKKHFEIVEAIWAFFEKHYEPARKAKERLDGSQIGKIQPRSFQAPWGTVTGGYIQSTRDQGYAELVSGSFSSDFSVEDKSHPTHELVAMSNEGAFEQRTGAVYPLSLSMEYLPTQYHRILQMAYLKPDMAEFGKILDHPDFRAAMEARRKGAMKHIIIPWFQRTMGQQYETPSKTSQGFLERTARKGRNNMHTAVFIFNYASALRQTLGIFPAMEVVPMHYLAMAQAEIISDGFKRFGHLSKDAREKAGHDFAIEQIMEVSKRMRVRFEGDRKRILLAADQINLNGDYIADLSEMQNRATFFLIQVMQNRVDVAIWKGAYNYGVKKLGLTEKQAVAHADNAVERTQGSSNISSRASILDGGPFKRLVTSFITYPLANFGVNVEKKMRNADKNIALRYALILKTMAVTALLPELMEAAFVLSLMSLKVDVEDEDIEKYKERSGMRVLSATIETQVPVVGRIAFDIATGDAERINPTLKMADSVYKFIKALMLKKDGVDLPDSFTRDLNQAFTLFTGLSVFAPTAIWDRLMQTFESNKAKKGRRRKRRKQLGVRRKKEEIKDRKKNR